MGVIKILDRMQPESFFPAGTIYIDQKACTTYIAHECYRQGRDNVTATLREKFSQYNCEKKDAIKKDAECQIETIEKQRQGRDVFIMHIRRSSGANNQQDLIDTFHLKISEFLDSKGYYVCYIYADKRKKESSIGKNFMLISPFAPLTKCHKHYPAMRKIGI